MIFNMKKFFSIFVFALFAQTIFAQAISVMGVQVNQSFNSFANSITPKLISISFNTIGAIHGKCNFAGFNDCEFIVIGWTNECGDSVNEISIGIKSRTPEKTLQDIMSSLKNKYGLTFQIKPKGISSNELGIIGHSFWTAHPTYFSNKKGSVTISCHIYDGEVRLCYYVDCHQSFNSSDL